jgi:cytochrome P450
LLRLHALPRFAKPLERNMLDLDEPGHTRLRTLVHRAFTPAMVERLQERIQEIADQLIDAVQQKSSMDLVRSAVTNSRVVVGERIPASISDFPTVCNQLSAALPDRLVCSATAND